METGWVVQVNRSPGGVPKLPVPMAVVGELGLEGDGHNDTTNHGGIERAVCLYSLERIEALRAEGHAIAPGTCGENVTVAGIKWANVEPGARFVLGDTVVLEVTRFTTPCKTIAGSFRDGDFNRIHRKLYPGWSRVYAKVLRGGVIRQGDAVLLVPAGEPLPEGVLPLG